MEIQRLFAQRVNAEVPKTREIEPKDETLGIGEPVVPEGKDDDPGIDDTPDNNGRPVLKNLEELLNGVKELSVPKDTKTETEKTAKNTKIQDGQRRMLKGEKSADAVVEKYKEMGFTDEIISEYFDIVEDHGEWYLDPKDGYKMDRTIVRPEIVQFGVKADGTREKFVKQGEETITYTLTKKDGSGSVKIQLPSDSTTFTQPRVTKYDKDGNVIKDPEDTPEDTPKAEITPKRYSHFASLIKNRKQ